MSARVTLTFPRYRPFLGTMLFALLISAGAALAANESIPDPCKLVTASEVQTVIGAGAAGIEPHIPPKPDKRPVRMCSYRGTNGRMMTVYIGPRTKAEFDKEGAGHQQVTGIGDAAYMVPPGIIGVHKGAREVIIQSMDFSSSQEALGVGAKGDPAVAARLKTLALAAAARM
jgi:hypothetical protein